MSIRVKAFVAGLILAAVPMAAQGQEFRSVAMRTRFMEPVVEKEKKAPPRAAVAHVWLERDSALADASLLNALPLRDSVITRRTPFLTEDRLDVLHLWESKLRLACFHQRMHFSPLRSAFPRMGASGLALSHESPLYTHSSTSYGLSISFHFGGAHDHTKRSRFSWFGR